MNFIKKINISSYGHYNYEALRDNAEMLHQILIVNKINSKISSKIKKKKY